MRWSAFGIVGGVLVLSTSAFAQEKRDHDALTSQSVFEQARAFMESGDLEHACPLFAESQRIDPGGGTLLNLAVCHEKQGKIGMAWTEYNSALSAAVRDGRADRQTYAEARIAALRSRVPHVVVMAPEHPPEGIAIALDGEVISSSVWGVPIAIDPGAHEVQVRAPGYAERVMHIASIGEGARFEVQVPPLQRETAQAHAPIVEGIPKEGPSTPQTKRIATTGYILGGVAVAGYVASIVTGVLALSAHHEANSKCDPARNFCADPSGQSDANRANTLAWISTATLAAGVGASVAAFVWPRTSSAPSSASIEITWHF